MHFIQIHKQFILTIQIQQLIQIYPKKVKIKIWKE